MILNPVFLRLRKWYVCNFGPRFGSKTNSNRCQLVGATIELKAIGGAIDGANDAAMDEAAE